MKRFIKRFRYGQKGFTLIELLVVIAILGVLAAIAIPNVGKFIGAGKTQAAETELHNVQTAVMAAMADGATGNVSNPGPFGNVGLTIPPTGSVDCTVDTGPPERKVGDYIVGGYQKVSGSYTITSTGDVTQIGYPD